MKDKWDEIAERAWRLIQERVKEMREKGMSFQDIANASGAKNRNVPCQWLEPHRVGKGVIFQDMLRYLSNLDIDIYALLQGEENIRFVKKNTGEEDSLQNKVDKLLIENQLLKAQIEKQENKIIELSIQLHEQKQKNKKTRLSIQNNVDNVG